jgi:uncharacterized membrane protein YjjP (DUF1212 family)
MVELNRQAEINQRQAQKQVLLLAMKAGEIMLCSGSEVYRVEQTVESICRACNMPYVECFATTTVISASLGDVEADAEMSTLIRRVKEIDIDLDKVSQVHIFARDFATNDLSVEDGFDILRRIEESPLYTLPIRLIGVVLVAVFYTMMVHGSPVDAVCSVFAGIGAYMLSLGIGHMRINRFIAILSSCFLCAALAFLFYLVGWTSSLSAIIIGAITIFLPGVAATNAARDLLSGDMLAGVARVTQALLVAVAIAGGVGLLLVLVQSDLAADASFIYPLPLQFMFGLLGTLGVSLVLNIPRRYLAIVSLVAGCGWTIFEILILDGEPYVVACFITVCFIALIAEIITHITKDTASVFIIPAIYLVVPGIGLYNTMLSLLQNDLAKAASSGVESVLIAGSIALALLVAISITRVLSAIYRRSILKKL